MIVFRKILSLALLLSVLLTACSPASESPTGEQSPEGKLPASASQEMTLYVAASLADCEAEGKTSCLLVREDLAVDFTVFTSDIDGFTYEPGYEYELRVIRTEVENPQAGDPQYRWVLLEEVNKSAVESAADAPMTLPAIIGTDWAWVRTERADETIESNGPERYTLLLLEDGTFQARLDCNSLVGTYTIEEDRLILVPGPMTLAICAEDSQADLFMESLNQSGTLLMTQSGLTIALPDGGTMFFVFNDVAAE